MTTQEFITKLTPENEGLIAKMQAVKVPEEAYAVAQAEGVADSFEEFLAEMTRFYEAIKDLSDGDLDAVAGGVDPGFVITSAVVTGGISVVSGTVSAVIALTLI
jgi:hypothetical protein